MKVLIADKLETSAVQELEANGLDVDLQPDVGAEKLADAIARSKADVLVVRSTKVSAAALTASDRLKLVVRAGAGYDTIDLETASREGIFVANCPGKNSIAVAELTWGLILAADRRIAAQDHMLKNGQWDKKTFSKARGLYGRTLGILGMGSIGRSVAKRGKAFGMRVVAWSRSLTEAKADRLGIERAESALEVARMADVLTVHVAGTGETAGLISAELLAAMPAGAILVNTSRGSVVDEPAVLAAIADRGLQVGLDVYAGEPGSGNVFESALAAHPSVVGTHHIGASTDQAQEAIAAEVARIVCTFQEQGTVPNCVNLAERAGQQILLTVRHKNRPGVLAKVFDVLSRAEINVEWMDNVLYGGADAACARIQLGTAPDDQQIGQIRASTADILSVELTAPSAQAS